MLGDISCISYSENPRVSESDVSCIMYVTGYDISFFRQDPRELKKRRSVKVSDRPMRWYNMGIKLTLFTWLNSTQCSYCAFARGTAEGGNSEILNISLLFED